MTHNQEFRGNARTAHLDQTRNNGSASLTQSTERINPVFWIPLDEVIVPTDQQRRTPSTESVTRLAQSFTDVGMLMPIGVTREKVLIFGNTRLAAAKMLGWEQIETREFISADDPRVRDLMEWDENDARTDLTFEQKLAYKRAVVDPLMKDRAAANKSAAGKRMMGNLVQYSLDGGKFPPSGRGASERQPAAAERELGKSRDLVAHYLAVSGKTMAKYEQLDKWSRDQSLSREVRKVVMAAKERANALGRVDGEYKKARTAIERLMPPTSSADLLATEKELKLLRGFSTFGALLEKYPAETTAIAITDDGWHRLADVLDTAMTWGLAMQKILSDKKLLPASE
ncbi:MAG: hypothetical protein B5766_11180 [Candidatus Lumbricidophila eiseniae]|uniref:ParB-like N-terminal domain-containing protein n=1 Tax=Candidatus Lumbricidiphila eiseniae TaxID=1969409 RepID=A0A2A6FNL7_9MICO|nr:MAG: hypothetical protein B5766_11180 [Candidatus Lumbricidophila eiseniae]